MSEEKSEGDTSWVGAVVSGVVSIVGAIFSNKKESDAVKRQKENIAHQQKEQQAKDESILKNYIAGTDKRYIELGRQLKKSVFGKAPALTPQEQAEYDNLHKQDQARQKSAGDQMFFNPFTGVKNAVTNPDGGFASGAGSSANPFTIDGGTITGKLDKVKQAGIHPLLLLGIVGAGGYAIYQSRNPRRGKRRR